MLFSLRLIRVISGNYLEVESKGRNKYVKELNVKLLRSQVFKAMS